MDKLEQKALCKLREIIATLPRCTTDDTGLYTGIAGHLLLGVEYAQLQEQGYNTHLATIGQRIFDQSSGLHHSFFAEGLSGIRWLFRYLEDCGAIDEQDATSCCSHHTATLLKQSLSAISTGNFDFLYGGLGIAFETLYNCQPANEHYFTRVFCGLSALFSNGSEHDVRDKVCPPTGGSSGTIFDLGLAHGIPAILKFCIECYKRDVCKAESRALVKQIIAIMEAQIDLQGMQSSLPNFTVRYGNKRAGSRLAWCYGDPSAGYILYQAGLTFGQESLTELSLHVLLKTTRRRTPAETGVSDAAICHGSAGVAHIYNRLWHATLEPEFESARNYWTNQTLTFANHKDGLAGYKKYSASDKSHVNDAGLIEGITGIGLVLQSYLSGRFDWDYCLLLND